MNELYFYATPIGAVLTLTLDHGAVLLTGVPVTANGRDDAQRVTLPDGTPQQGATLKVAALSTDPALVFPPFNGRGIVVPALDGAAPRFWFDDIRLTAIAAPAPPVPVVPIPPNPNDPHDVILWVYGNGSYDLATPEGCGLFVEACALTLYTHSTPAWGHVRKFPGQVQWNGHAIDAIHALAGEFVGIWDIITDSQVPGAKPAFNYAGAADPALWYPGNLAAPPARAALGGSVPTTRRKRDARKSER